MTKLFGFAAAAATAFTLGMVATPASATVTLLEPGCDLYSADGCLFSHDGGGEFDDAALLKAAYDAAHNATPAPEDLPANFAFLGKTGEGGIDNGPDEANTWTFTDLPFDVSYYLIKAGNDQVLLFGLSPPTDSFTTASSARLGHAISHVTFFGGDDGGGGNEIPEPSTWALMIMGFGSAGAMLRSRRTKLAKVSA